MINRGHPDTVPAPHPPTTIHPPYDEVRDWEDQIGVMENNQAARRGARQGELRGKYESLKQFVRYVESLRRQAEARAQLYGTVIVGGLIAILVLWTLTSLAFHRPVWPWEMLAISGAQ